jgi:hypothetical protein
MSLNFLSILAGVSFDPSFFPGTLSRAYRHLFYTLHGNLVRKDFDSEKAGGGRRRKSAEKKETGKAVRIPDLDTKKKKSKQNKKPILLFYRNPFLHSP